MSFGSVWSPLRLSRTSSTPFSPSSTTYTYNGDGTLVKQVASGTTTLYTQDLASPLTQILQTKVGSAMPTDYVYGLNRLASLNGSTTTWYASDALGSVRRTFNTSATPLGIVNYDPWGTPEAGSVPTFGFTGELQDTTTGLVSLGAIEHNMIDAQKDAAGAGDANAPLGNDVAAMKNHNVARMNGDVAIKNDVVTLMNRVAAMKNHKGTMINYAAAMKNHDVALRNHVATMKNHNVAIMNDAAASKRRLNEEVVQRWKARSAR